MRTDWAESSCDHHLPKSEQGNITVISIGFMLVLALVVLVVVNASVVFLEHRRLANDADRIALYAADSLDESYYLSGAVVGEVSIDLAAAQRLAAEELGLETTAHISVSGDRVFVRLERAAELWLVPFGAKSSLVVAEAEAQLTILN